MKSLRVTLRVWPWVLSAIVVVGVLGVSMRPAQGGDPGDDGVPSGTVAFFGGSASCPLGWAPADMVTGRAVVAVNDGSSVGRTVGTALRDREDRTHTHTLTGTVGLPSRTIAGADGTNNQGAAAGDHRVTGTANAATSGLPFVQLRACVKQ